MFDRAILRRIAAAIVAAEIGRLRGANGIALPPGAWAEAMPLGADGIGLDSLERMGALAALGEAFRIDAAAPARDAPATVGDWIDWIARDGDRARFAVSTSGSTGLPRLCVHAVADLLDEARCFAAAFADRRRIVAMVPGHHLYGLIWTILLPAALDVPVVPAAIGVGLDLRPGDLVVAVPEQWRALLRLVPRFPADLCGVSSAGGLPGEVADGLLDAGMARLVDVYGASETGAIAMREAAAADYTLLPRWSLVTDGAALALADASGRRMPLPDHVERTGDRALRPIARRDEAVQVGGRNVWPERVAAVLRAHEGVADVAVRLGGNGRLKAFVVPGDGVSADAVIRDLQRLAGDALDEAERPRAFATGAALPRNAMGKVTDWL